MIIKNTYLITALLITCFLQKVAGQNWKIIDSLQIEINLKKGIDKYQPMIDLAIQYVDYDRNLCVHYLGETQKLASQFGDSSKIVKSGRLIGEVFRIYEKNKEALEILNYTLPIARRNKLTADIKYILNSLALLHTTNGAFDKALAYNLESLIIRESEGDKKAISITLNNIGFVYLRLKSYQNALEYYNRSLKLKRASNDDHDLDRLLINIGLCHNAIKNFTESQKCFTEVFESCKDNCKPVIKVEGKFGLGHSKMSQGKNHEALKYFQESYALAKESQNGRFQAENLINMAVIYSQGGNEAKAITLLEEAQQLADSFGYNELAAMTLYELSLLHYKSKDFQKASVYQQKYIQLRNSVFNEELTTNLMKIEAEYQGRENSAKIVSQQQILTLKEDVIKGQQLLNYFISIMVLMLIASALVLITNNRQRKKISKILDVKVNERTQDLEHSYEALVRATWEKDLVIDLATRSINSSLKTIKGLCNLASRDVSDPQALQYISKLDLGIDQMVFRLKHLKSLDTSPGSSQK